MNFVSELKKTLSLAVPIIAGHVSQMLLGFADTLMIGKVSVVALAASGFANAIWHVLFVLGIGLLTPISILVSHAFGAGNNRETGEMLRRGIVIGLAFSFLIVFGIVGILPHLSLFGQPPEVTELSRSYIMIIMSSMPFALLTMAFKNFSEAQNVAWPALWAGLLSVILNVFLNWMFIYGNFGAPQWGLFGAGFATFLSRIVGTALLIFWLVMDKRFAGKWPKEIFAPIPISGLISMLRIGFPVGIQIMMEVGAFAGSTIIMGLIGVVELASHQIAITYAATTFMFPLGISLAVSIRVGQAVGSGEAKRARTIGFSAILLAAFISGFFSLIFILYREFFAGLITTDPATIILTAQLLVIAAFFQFFDGTQVVAIGALRGCKDVKIPTAIIFGAYWILAIPFGAVLAFALKVGAVGIWYGLALGLGAASAMLTYRFHQITLRAQFNQPFAS